MFITKYDVKDPTLVGIITETGDREVIIEFSDSAENSLPECLTFDVTKLKKYNITEDYLSEATFYATISSDLSKGMPYIIPPSTSASDVIDWVEDTTLAYGGKAYLFKDKKDLQKWWLYGDIPQGTLEIKSEHQTITIDIFDTKLNFIETITTKQSRKHIENETDIQSILLQEIYIHYNSELTKRIGYFAHCNWYWAEKKDPVLFKIK